MIYVLIALLIFAVESVIKYLVEKLATDRKRVPIFGGKLYLTKYHNKGAFLNFGEGRRVAVKYMSLILSAGCLVIFVFTLGKHGKKLQKTALSMLLGGALSNTCDRISRGYVVDYFGFNVKNKRLSNIIFNISDFFIMAGALLSVLQIPGRRNENLCYEEEGKV